MYIYIYIILKQKTNASHALHCHSIPVLCDSLNGFVPQKQKIQCPKIWCFIIILSMKECHFRMYHHIIYEHRSPFERTYCMSIHHGTQVCVLQISCAVKLLFQLGNLLWESLIQRCPFGVYIYIYRLGPVTGIPSISIYHHYLLQKRASFKPLY